MTSSPSELLLVISIATPRAPAADDPIIMWFIAFIIRCMANDNLSANNKSKNSNNNNSSNNNSNSNYSNNMSLANNITPVRTLND